MGSECSVTSRNPGEGSVVVLLLSLPCLATSVPADVCGCILYGTRVGTYSWHDVKQPLLLLSSPQLYSHFVDFSLCSPATTCCYTGAIVSSHTHHKCHFVDFSLCRPATTGMYMLLYRCYLVCSHTQVSSDFVTSHYGDQPLHVAGMPIILLAHLQTHRDCTSDYSFCYRHNQCVYVS